MYLLDITGQQRLGIWISINDLSRYTLTVSSKWRCGQAYYFGVRKSFEDFPPTIRHIVMAFVDEDHVKEIRRELRKPSIRGTCELLNVCHDIVALSAIMNICIGAVQYCDKRTILECGKNLCFTEKEFLVSHLQCIGYSLAEQ